MTFLHARPSGEWAYMHVAFGSLEGSLQCRERFGALTMQGFIQCPVETPMGSMAALHV